MDPGFRKSTIDALLLNLTILLELIPKVTTPRPGEVQPERFSNLRNRLHAIQSMLGGPRGPPNFLGGFKSGPLADLGENTLQSVANAMERLAGHLRVIDSHPEQATDEKLQGYVNDAEALLATGALVVAYLAAKNPDVAAIADEARMTFAQLRDETNQKVNEIKTREVEAKRALESIRQAAAEKGVSTHAMEFDALVNEHTIYARRWLVTTAVLALASAAAVWVLVHGNQLEDRATNATIARFVMTRVTAFALASFLTVWAARNYRAHRHLHVINQHKHKALLTFGTFAAATVDDAIRNAVLLEATRCIFSSGSTGYSTEEPEGPSDRVIEVVKTFIDKR